MKLLASVISAALANDLVVPNPGFDCWVSCQSRGGKCHSGACGTNGYCCSWKPEHNGSGPYACPPGAVPALRAKWSGVIPSGAATCVRANCRSGYAWDGRGCQDINECVSGTDNCGPNATCQNTAGGFTCSCKDGFKASGNNCVDIDECADNNGNCPANSTCKNQAGTHYCPCNDGYTPEANTCIDVDECKNNNGGCRENSTCKNEAGSHSCPCDAGFNDEGGKCVKKEEPAAGDCPSRCWKKDGDKCVIDADQKCSTVTCDHDKMTVEFDSDLFNVDDNQNPNPFGENFSFSDGKWKMNCPLGGCNMDAVCEDVTGDGKKEHIVFNVPVSAGTDEVVNVLGKEVKLSSEGPKVEFQCAYPITVNVESNEFTTERQPSVTPPVIIGPIHPTKPTIPVCPWFPQKPVNPVPPGCKVDCDPVFPVVPPIGPIPPVGPNYPGIIGPCWPGPIHPKPTCPGKNGPGTPIFLIHPGPGPAKGKCVYALDKKTGRAVYPMDPKTGKPIFYTNPETCKPEPCVDPETGLPTYPGDPIDPETGEPMIDPNTGEPIDPETCDPSVVPPIYPTDPDTGKPIYPPLPDCGDPACMDDKGEPVWPTEVVPGSEPEVVRPVYPVGPLKPIPTYPTDPNTGEEVYPVDPITGNPIYPINPTGPGKGKCYWPISANTQKPMWPKHPVTGKIIWPRTDDGKPFTCVDPETGVPIYPTDPETGDPIYPTDPDTDEPIIPKEIPKVPEDPFPFPIHPGPGPATGKPTYPIDPETGDPYYPADPDTGDPIFPIDPETGKPTNCVDPETGEPTYPGKTTDPNTGDPIIDPDTGKPIDLEDVDPTVCEPIFPKDPDTGDPIYPDEYEDCSEAGSEPICIDENNKPKYPTTTSPATGEERPVYPVGPLEPSNERPEFPVHPGPGPGKGKPTYPVDPDTLRPTYPTDPETGEPKFPTDPETGKPTNCVDPTTGEPIFPGITTDDEGKPLIDPVTKKPVDVETVDPTSCKPIFPTDPDTGHPIYPEEYEECNEDKSNRICIEPGTGDEPGTPVYPIREGPDNHPLTGEPVYPVGPLKPVEPSPTEPLPTDEEGKPIWPTRPGTEPELPICVLPDHVGVKVYLTKVPTGKEVEEGSLTEGFGIDIFVDPDREVPATSENPLYVGAQVYAEVNWEVAEKNPLLSKLVNFYVESCDVDFGDDKVDFPIIDDNCYSGLFDARLGQDEKVVEQTSALSFKSFVVGRGAKEVKLNLKCCVKVCVLDECDAFIKVRDDQCPNNSFRYAANRQ